MCIIRGEILRESRKKRGKNEDKADILPRTDLLVELPNERRDSRGKAVKPCAQKWGPKRPFVAEVIRLF